MKSSEPRLVAKDNVGLKLGKTTIYVWAVLAVGLMNLFSSNSHHRYLKTPIRWGDDDKAKTEVAKRMWCRIEQHLPYFGILADGTKPYYQCAPGSSAKNQMVRKWGGPNGKRLPLPPVLSSSGVLDFHVKLQTSLKILVVGNSLSQQNFYALQEAFCYPHHHNDTTINNNNTNNNTNNNIIASQPCRTFQFTQAGDKFGKNAKLSEVVHVPGGGFIAHWGTKEMIQVDKQNLTEWRQGSSALQLLRNASLTQSTNMDILIFHIPCGHIQLKDVTEESLSKIVSLAHGLFHCSTVIFVNMAWHNGVVSEKVRQLEAGNEVIKRFVEGYLPRHDGTSVQHVELLDFASLTQSIIEANGASLGMTLKETYELRLADSRFKGLVAQNCGEIPNQNKTCKPNMFAADGIHWCPETIHGRVSASLACILGCIHNSNAQNGADHSLNSGIAGGIQETIVEGDHLAESKRKSCSDQCNSRFMNLDPVSFNVEGYEDL
jgi:hypothetical protein